MAGNIASISKTLPHVIYPLRAQFYELVVVLEGFPCFVCREKKRVVTMLSCNQCQHGWHMTCLRPPLTSLPSGQWNWPRYGGSLMFGACTNCIQ